ncbi:hypothetical protein Tco_0130087, partial [Tanacetum coccineum]
MSAMLSSDATLSMEMFPFGHCPKGNGDVSSVCFNGDAQAITRQSLSTNLAIFEEAE